MTITLALRQELLLTTYNQEHRDRHRWGRGIQLQCLRIDCTAYTCIHVNTGAQQQRNPISNSVLFSMFKFHTEHQTHQVDTYTHNKGIRFQFLKQVCWSIVCLG